MAAPAMRCDQFEDGAGIAAAIGHRLAGRGTGCQKVRDGALSEACPGDSVIATGGRDDPPSR